VIFLGLDRCCQFTCVRLCVGHSLIAVSPAEMAEPIKMVFGEKSETHQIYTSCSLIIAAVNAPISDPTLHSVSEWQHDHGIFANYSYLGTEMSLISRVTWQKFIKFLHDVAISSPLLMCTFKQVILQLVFER